jgi:hypothetical protein
MARRVAGLILAVLFLASVYGCFAVIAGGAAGGGTAVWLSDKLTQQFNASYERTITAGEKALKSLRLTMKSEKKQEEVTQLRSEYTDGKEIWIDIRKVTENSTKVDVRVGAVNPDKEAADKILKKIQSYL